MSTLLALSILVHFCALPTDAELADAKKWADAKFVGITESAPAAAGIQVVLNNDVVQPNSRGGKPMNISGKQFTRGLYCHAPSKLIVTLPKPGAKFEAIAGVDTNDDTSGGRGSVVFICSAGGKKKLWQSPLTREGMPPQPVSVDLQGARELILEAQDGGDGISCDQSDWADARVTLQDGQVLWLGDMPLNGQQRKPYDATPVFSFVYDGKSSAEFLKDWKLTRTSKPLDDKRTEHTLTYTDPGTGLIIRCVGVTYADFPVVEWTLYFKNTGQKDSPILSNIQAVDTSFQRAANEFILHQNKGDDCTADSYEPIDEPLRARVEKKIHNERGRPTQIAFPYFNLEFAPDGLIFVVSWAGQWAASFARDDANGINLRAGQELTHFKLLPGEEVRSPMIVLQFYKGDRLHAQNVWRAWMIAHNIPRPGGKLPPVPQLAACSSHQFGEMINANRDNQIFFVDKYLERGIKLDYWWMDAGWYICDGQWPKTGTWEVDTNRFPGGLRAITDHAHAKDVRSIVWFEPERVHGGTWLADTHPEWVYGGKSGGLLKLGEPEVRQWLTDHVDKLLTEQGIDLYRQDFNMDPLASWRKNDAEDRQGITEIRHVEGYFAYWDELRRRHPNMLIDSCASGGRRNDLETLRRAVPLLRSDYIMEPTGNQCHTYTLASWFPFYGTGTSKTDPYLIRSTLCPHFTACWDQRDDKIDWATIKKLVDEWKQYALCYFGDYYPLSSYSLANDQWIAWQFHRPDTGEGMVQVFRRPDSPYESARFKLKGLDVNTRYKVVNLDAADAASDLSGTELSEVGLKILIDHCPGTAFLTYRKF